MADVEIAILGSLRVRRGGRDVSVEGRHTRALVGYLALRPGRAVSRDDLVAVLWPAPPPTAAKIVQIAVSQSRKALGPDVLVTEQHGYRLAVPPESVDAERAEALAADGRRALAAGRAAEAAGAFEAALATWRGNLLEDVEDAPFVGPERLRLEGLRLSVVEDYAEAMSACGRDADVLPDLDRLAREHPERERLVAQLMVALYRAGRQADALAAYREARSRLVGELGIEPGPGLRRVERAVLAHDPSLEAPPFDGFEGARVPAMVGPLLGREEELRELESLLGSGKARLVTLTGPGGVGKTRLAVEVARRVAKRFPGGILFVPLDTLADPTFVVPTVERMLGAGRDRGASPQLVVLDSLEHLVAAAPALVGLVAGTPQRTFLATSRERLRLSIEHELALAPLATPGRAANEPRGLEAIPSVALFLDRARRLDPRFELTPENAATIAEICRRVDGLPLALELAAARTRLLTPSALLGRLTRRLDLLVAGAQDVPPRHRTLRATIDWSFALLAPSERTMLGQLAVFAGGWTLDAAEAVCDVEDVLGSLASLSDKSLVRREPGGDLRFGMLDSIREYAVELLRAQDDHEAVQERHRTYFTVLAEAARHNFCGPREGEWLDRLERDHANLRAALEFALSTHDEDTAYRLATALGRFWLLRGHLHDGRRLLDETLARFRGQPGARASLLTAAGRLATEQGDLDAAAPLFGASLAIGEELGDGARISAALAELGTVALHRRDDERAREYLSRSAELDLEQGDTANAAVGIHQLAMVASAEGDLDDACAHLQRSIALAREAGASYCLAAGLRALARLSLSQDEDAPVEGLLAESIALADELGDRQGLAETIEHIAVLAAARGDSPTGARLLGAAEHAQSTTGTSPAEYERARAEQAARAVGADAGGPHVEAYRHGFELALESALEEARRVVAP